MGGDATEAEEGGWAIPACDLIHSAPRDPLPVQVLVSFRDHEDNGTRASLQSCCRNGRGIQNRVSLWLPLFLGVPSTLRERTFNKSRPSWTTPCRFGEVRAASGDCLLQLLSLSGGTWDRASVALRFASFRSSNWCRFFFGWEGSPKIDQKDKQKKVPTYSIRTSNLELAMASPSRGMEERLWDLLPPKAKKRIQSLATGHEAPGRVGAGFCFSRPEAGEKIRVHAPMKRRGCHLE